MRPIAGLYGTQVALMVLQLGYAAISSRSVTPSGFGAFAVALSASALGSILATAGVANAIARRTSSDVHGDRVLVTLSLASGGAFALLMVLIAPWWARLWDNDQATDLVRLMALAVLFMPIAGSLGGVLRRHARFRAYSVVLFVSSVLAMLVGGLLVFSIQRPWTLTVLPVLIPVLTVAFSAPITGRRALPTVRLAGSRSDVSFSIKSLGASMTLYLAGLVPTLALGRSLGPNTLGAWNRAVALGVVPLETFTRSATTVLYPKFRNHAEGSDDVRRNWTVMLVAMALLVVPAVALLIPLAPALTLVVLGPQWNLAGQMVPWLLANSAVFSLATLLAGALESSNRFRGVGAPLVGLLVGLTLSAAALVASGDWRALGAGMVLSAVAYHALQLTFAVRHAVVRGRQITRWYATILGLSVALGAAVAAADRLGGTLVAIVVAAFLGLAYVGILLKSRRRIELSLE